MTIDEAQAEAVRRWGPNGQVVESSYRGETTCEVGVRVLGESRFAIALAGKGHTWEAAFAEADGHGF